MFPSRVESFGYGVLEMLAAAVPVIAYDAPGPHVMLPPEYRVPVGAAGDMADRVCDLLTDPDRLRAARLLGMRPCGVVRLGACGHGHRSSVPGQAGWSTRAAARPDIILSQARSLYIW